VLKAAIGLHAGVQRILAGVAERRVPKVMSEGNALGQVFVQSQCPGNRAGDLGNLDGMGQPGAEQVAFVIDEYLCLVLQTAEGRGVDDAVPGLPASVTA
jgi:hypothetical protein